MNLSAIYSKTGKGARALAARSKSLSAAAMRILAYIDGKTAAEVILPQLGKLSESKFAEALSQLIQDGYIKEIDSDYLTQSLSDFDIHTPIMVAEISAEEFMQIETAAEDTNNEVKAREQAEAEARALAYAAEQRKLQEAALKQEEAERRLLNVTDILAKSSDSLDIERLASNAPRRTKADAEARAKHKARKRAAAEQARQQAQQTEMAAHAEKLRIVAEEQAAEERVRQAQLEQAQQKELEQKALVEAEQKAKAALNAQIKQEAEKVALEVQQAAAAKALREEEDQRRHQAEQLAQEAERQARQQAQALAAAKAQQQAQARAQQVADKQALIEAEKQAAAERKAQQAIQAQAEREARQRLKAERLAKQEAETKLRAQAQAQAKQQAEQRARIEADNKALAKAQQTARKQAEKTLKAEARREAKQHAAAKAQAKAQERARLRQARPDRNYLLRLQQILSATKKTALGACVFILLALLLAPFVNLGFLLPPVQLRLAQALGEPVTVKTLHIKLWPQPHLLLGDVNIGSDADIKAESAEVYPVLTTLLSQTMALRAIEIDAMALDETNARRPLAWLENASKQGEAGLEHLALHQLAITWQGYAFPIVDADIDINKGTVRSALLKSADNHLTIKATPANDALMLAISASGWQVPLGSPVAFEELNAQGILTNNRLQLSQIDARLYDGTIKASMNLHWGDHWSGEGKFDLAQVDLSQATPAFTGKLGMQGKLAATAIFSLQANRLNELFAAPSINARFDSVHGAIEGIDLIRAIQTGGQQKTISGTTQFDQFSGHLILKNRHYQFRDLILKASQLQAKGEADIFANEDISGKIDIQLTASSRQLRSRIFLSGKLGQPTVK